MSKKLRAKAAAEKQQSITLVNQSFDERQIVVLRSDASDKTAKQNESDDHFRLADNTPGMVRALLAELAAYREHRFDTLGVRKKGQHDATIAGSAGPSVMGQVEGP